MAARSSARDSGTTDAGLEEDDGVGAGIPSLGQRGECPSRAERKRTARHGAGFTGCSTVRARSREQQHHSVGTQVALLLRGARRLCLEVAQARVLLDQTRHSAVATTQSAERRSPGIGIGTSVAQLHDGWSRWRSRASRAICGASSRRRPSGKSFTYGLRPTAAASRESSGRLTVRTRPCSIRHRRPLDMPSLPATSRWRRPPEMRARRSSRPTSRSIHRPSRVAS